MWVRIRQDTNSLSQPELAGVSGSITFSPGRNANCVSDKLFIFGLVRQVRMICSIMLSQRTIGTIPEPAHYWHYCWASALLALGTIAEPLQYC